MTMRALLVENKDWLVPTTFQIPLCTSARPTRSVAPSRPLTFTSSTRKRNRVYAASSDDEGKGLLFDAAARSFAKGQEQGLDADDLVAQQLGASDASQLTDVQEKYKEKLKERLEERAEELRKEKEARSIKFSQGKTAYERGHYSTAVTLLEQALNLEGPFTQLGGEIQMWLALGYQACGREQECIETYKIIEKSHPLPAIRRQAADLRYIMEAPKLQLNEDERVKIPVLNDLNVNRGGRSAVAPRIPRAVKPPKPKTWDEEFWSNYRPPQYLQNKYVWVAAWIVMVGLALWSTSGVMKD